MTSVLTADERRATGTMTKPTKPGVKKIAIEDPRNGGTRDEARAFLDFSRENLNISQTELEQGFNKPTARCRRPCGHSVLSLVAILVALACAGLEIWKLHRVISNTRDIEIIKRDVEALRHGFFGEDFMDELKAFEEQLYADGSEADEDSGEADIESSDYDSNYEDYNPSWNDYASGSGESTTVAATSSLAVHSMRKSSKSVESKVSHRRAETTEKSLRSSREKMRVSSPERIAETSEDHSKRRRAVTEEITTETKFDRASPVNSFPPGDRNDTRRENFLNADDQEHRSEKKKKKISNAETVSWERHPPKKYIAISRLDKPDDFPSPGESARRRHSAIIDHSQFRRLHQASELMRRSPKPRVITRRHLRAPRQMYAAHYGADSSLFGTEDEHTGNGRAKHNGGIFKAWRASEWVNDLGMGRHFTLSRDGRLAVHEPGLYLVYGQIHYLDEHDENGFHILVNGQPILQCMVYSPGTGHKSRSCFSAQITVLQAGDGLILKDAGPARYTLFQHDKSFFGLVKLGETRQQHQTQPKHTTQTPEDQ